MALESAWLDDLVQGFWIDRQAQGVSQETILDYNRTFLWLDRWLLTNAKTDLSATDLKAFLASQREGRSPKTLYNSWVALRAFYRWVSEETSCENPMLKVQAPKVPETVILPFTQEEVQLLLKACDKRPFRGTTIRRPTAVRDRAIVLTLVDTGLRASELCQLQVEDLDLETGQLFVRKGKGGKGRVVYVGKVTKKALWRYRAKQGKPKGSEPLFLSTEEQAMNRDSLRHFLAHLGERAGVDDVHPHRFRHTFATMFLRNGGNLLALQRLLGHSSLEMVRRYAKVAQTDLRDAHSTGSPADNWRL